ncbi:hypothetical protein A3844_11620 [Paenibacillus helianthi]|uniref:ABC transporter permease n=1 Tax=Paenibacillus helianthi TaxID=1349432 RepID=A0ABX3ES77_9BACL|nr:hypothetical protein [Paenibacillus helianthi]OKP86663.1 hypothetical protein A3844_11620 [Paenibacillus helianthi]
MWFLGLLFILIFYLSIGEMLNSSMFNIEFSLFDGIMLFLLCVVVFLFITSKYKKRIIVIWVLLSVVPGGAFIFYGYYTPSSGGWISFGWDWGLWDLFIPIIVAIAQGITIGLIKTIKPND